MMEIAPRLVPVFWGSLVVLGIAGLAFLTGITMTLGTSRPTALRVVWISAAALLAAGTALLVILTHS